MLSKTIYMDHAAATPLDSRVKAAMEPALSELFGNPGSLHTEGMRAKEALDAARASVASVLGCRSDEIIFTASGTESVNLAITGSATANQKRGMHIITTTIEHPAVLEACASLTAQGFTITKLPVDAEGMVDPAWLESEIRDDTILVSVMHANNEIGTVLPIKKIAAICKAHHISLHTDACQAAGALDIDVAELGVDMMSLNGSKIYGPKGVGCLFVRRGTALLPIIRGGEQEFGLRAGTENLAAIIGFAAALTIADDIRDRENARLTALRGMLIDGLVKVPETVLNGHPIARLANNVSVSLRGVEAHALLVALDERGICASTGSACTSSALKPSHVILAIGRKMDYAQGTVRFTLGRSTTEEDIRYVIAAVGECAARLRSLIGAHAKSRITVNVTK